MRTSGPKGLLLLRPRGSKALLFFMLVSSISPMAQCNQIDALIVALVPRSTWLDALRPCNFSACRQLAFLLTPSEADPRLRPQRQTLACALRGRPSLVPSEADPLLTPSEADPCLRPQRQTLALMAEGHYICDDWWGDPWILNFGTQAMTLWAFRERW